MIWIRHQATNIKVQRLVYPTYGNGVDQGSNSKRQAAAQHGEDGVAHVVFHRV